MKIGGRGRNSSVRAQIDMETQGSGCMYGFQGRKKLDYDYDYDYEAFWPSALVKIAAHLVEKLL